MNNNLHIFDNIGQELNDFDTVVVSDDTNECNIGIFYKTYVFMKKYNRNTVSMHRFPLFFKDEYEIMADRHMIENGDKNGEYKLKSAIKVNVANDVFMNSIEIIIDSIKEYKIADNIDRITVEHFLNDINKAFNSTDIANR